MFKNLVNFVYGIKSDWCLSTDTTTKMVFKIICVIAVRVRLR